MCHRSCSQVLSCSLNENETMSQASEAGSLLRRVQDALAGLAEHDPAGDHEPTPELRAAVREAIAAVASAGLIMPPDGGIDSLSWAGGASVPNVDDDNVSHIVRLQQTMAAIMKFFQVRSEKGKNPFKGPGAVAEYAQHIVTRIATSLQADTTSACAARGFMALSDSAISSSLDGLDSERHKALHAAVKTLTVTSRPGQVPSSSAAAGTHPSGGSDDDDDDLAGVFMTGVPERRVIEVAADDYAGNFIKCHRLACDSAGGAGALVPAIWLESGGGCGALVGLLKQEEARASATGTAANTLPRVGASAGAKTPDDGSGLGVSGAHMQAGQWSAVHARRPDSGSRLLSEILRRPMQLRSLRPASWRSETEREESRRSGRSGERSAPAPLSAVDDPYLSGVLPRQLPLDVEGHFIPPGERVQIHPDALQALRATEIHGSAVEALPRPPKPSLRSPARRRRVLSYGLGPRGSDASRSMMASRDTALRSRRPLERQVPQVPRLSFDAAGRREMLRHASMERISDGGARRPAPGSRLSSHRPAQPSNSSPVPRGDAVPAGLPPDSTQPPPHDFGPVETAKDAAALLAKALITAAAKATEADEAATSTSRRRGLQRFLDTCHPAEDVTTWLPEVRRVMSAFWVLDCVICGRDNATGDEAMIAARRSLLRLGAGYSGVTVWASLLIGPFVPKGLFGSASPFSSASSSSAAAAQPEPSPRTPWMCALAIRFSGTAGALCRSVRVMLGNARVIAASGLLRSSIGFPSRFIAAGLSRSDLDKLPQVEMFGAATLWTQTRNGVGLTCHDENASVFRIANVMSRVVAADDAAWSVSEAAQTLFESDSREPARRLLAGAAVLGVTSPGRCSDDSGRLAGAAATEALISARGQLVAALSRIRLDLMLRHDTGTKYMPTTATTSAYNMQTVVKTFGRIVSGYRDALLAAGEEVFAAKGRCVRFMARHALHATSLYDDLVSAYVAKTSDATSGARRRRKQEAGKIIGLEDARAAALTALDGVRDLVSHAMSIFLAEHRDRTSASSPRSQRLDLPSLWETLRTRGRQLLDAGRAFPDGAAELLYGVWYTSIHAALPQPRQSQVAGASIDFSGIEALDSLVESEWHTIEMFEDVGWPRWLSGLFPAGGTSILLLGANGALAGQKTRTQGSAVSSVPGVLFPLYVAVLMARASVCPAARCAGMFNRMALIAGLDGDLLPPHKTLAHWRKALESGGLGTEACRANLHCMRDAWASHAVRHSLEPDVVMSVAGSMNSSSGHVRWTYSANSAPHHIARLGREFVGTIRRRDPEVPEPTASGVAGADPSTHAAGSAEAASAESGTTPSSSAVTSSTRTVGTRTTWADLVREIEHAGEESSGDEMDRPSFRETRVTNSRAGLAKVAGAVGPTGSALRSIVNPVQGMLGSLTSSHGVAAARLARLDIVFSGCSLKKVRDDIISNDLLFQLLPAGTQRGLLTGLAWGTNAHHDFVARFVKNLTAAVGKQRKQVREEALADSRASSSSSSAAPPGQGPHHAMRTLVRGDPYEVVFDRDTQRQLCDEYGVPCPDAASVTDSVLADPALPIGLAEPGSDLARARRLGWTVSGSFKFEDPDSVPRPEVYGCVGDSCLGSLHRSIGLPGSNFRSYRKDVEHAVLSGETTASSVCGLVRQPIYLGCLPSWVRINLASESTEVCRLMWCLILNTFHIFASNVRRQLKRRMGQGMVFPSKDSRERYPETPHVPFAPVPGRGGVAHEAWKKLYEKCQKSIGSNFTVYLDRVPDRIRREPGELAADASPPSHRPPYLPSAAPARRPQPPGRHPAVVDDISGKTSSSHALPSHVWDGGTAHPMMGFIGVDSAPLDLGWVRAPKSADVELYQSISGAVHRVQKSAAGRSSATGRAAIMDSRGTPTPPKVIRRLATSASAETSKGGVTPQAVALRPLRPLVSQPRALAPAGSASMRRRYAQTDVKAATWASRTPRLRRGASPRTPVPARRKRRRDEESGDSDDE